MKHEIALGKIKILQIKGLKIFREFNFVYLGDSDEEFVKNFIEFCLK